MGYTLKWIAVHGAKSREVLEELQLRSAGAADRGMPRHDGITAASLPRDWYVIAVDHEDGDVFTPGSLARLSSGHQVILCAIDEQEMTSSASGWADGTQLWSVEHQQDHLDVRGRTPEAFHALNKSDPFNVPIELARLLTGFRHDVNEVNGEELKMELLQFADEDQPKKRKSGTAIVAGVIIAALAAVLAWLAS